MPSSLLSTTHSYEETHEPETLRISKALSKRSTISAIDYVLPQVVKLSKTLQTEKLDVTIISSLVEATLRTIDNALTPAANWVLALCDIEAFRSRSQWMTSSLSKKMLEYLLFPF